MDDLEDQIIESAITTFGVGYTVPADGVAPPQTDNDQGRRTQTALDDGGQYPLKINHGWCNEAGTGDLGCIVDTTSMFVRARDLSVGPNVGWCKLPPNHPVVSYDSVMQVSVYCSRQQAVPGIPGITADFQATRKLKDLIQKKRGGRYYVCSICGCKVPRGRRYRLEEEGGHFDVVHGGEGEAKEVTQEEHEGAPSMKRGPQKGKKGGRKGKK